MIQNNALKNLDKKKRKLSYELTYTKIRLARNELKISKKYFSLQAKHHIKHSNDAKKIILNKTFNKDINKKNKPLLPLKNKGKEKSELLKKINKNKFIFSTLAHRNKGDLMRDKLISLSKNKNINSYTYLEIKKVKIHI